jgi:hypothetical protein
MDLSFGPVVSISVGSAFAVGLGSDMRPNIFSADPGVVLRNI